MVDEPKKPAKSGASLAMQSLVQEIERQREFQRSMLAPFKEARRQMSVQAASASAAMFKEIERHREYQRALLGPFEDLRRHLAVDSSFQLAIEQARQTAEELRRSFLLPDVAESMRLLHERHRELGESLRGFADESRFAETLAAMRSPWLDAAREVQSLRGFTALQSMGHVLRELPAFGDTLAEPLRQELGDWRDTITFDESALQGIGSRTDFYIARGLNTELTDFPADAFSESLKVAA